MRNHIDDDATREEITRRAYWRFCDRGCVDGSDLDDWLIAERAVLAEQDRARSAGEPSAQANTTRRSKRGPRRG